ncbi:hypothetical protein [Microvirga calopogonii]|uniref:hypothetical protein n=1 Tax=Microvirga calopogonii TaxID=2078013 RepID=UPI000E0CED06|nr:hypothetical protein [Microvirga calopogonii]
MSDDVKTAVQSWIAENQMQAVQDYVSRGRRLEHSPEEALAAAWIVLMRAWAKAPGMGHEPRRIDIEAEYSLRGLKPPYELVGAEMEAITRATAGALEDLDKINRDRLNSEILDLRSSEKSRTN